MEIIGNSKLWLIVLLMVNQTIGKEIQEVFSLIANITPLCVRSDVSVLFHLLLKSG
jgi:hypothetical protein